MREFYDTHARCHDMYFDVWRTNVADNDDQVTTDRRECHSEF